jgi:ribose transport system substrate-binding protein
MSPSFRRSFSRSIVPAAGFVAAALALAACSSSGGSSSSSSSASSAATSSSSSSSSASGKTYNVAYLSYAVANDYDKGMLANAQAVAAKSGIKITVFDAANSSNTQYSQMQTAISSGKYQGIITQPIVGTALVPLVQQAIAAGIKVVNMDQILGSNLRTAAPQVQGLSGNAVFVPYTTAVTSGKLAAQACESVNANPCDIGFLYDVKASQLDIAEYAGFVVGLKADPNAKITNTGQTNFTQAQALTATQDMLTANPNLKVIWGSDQGAEGAASAVAAAGKQGKVLIIGAGGGSIAIADVKSGVLYGELFNAPATEGTVAMQMMAKALTTGQSSGGVNVAATFPNGGAITKANVDQFKAQYTG